MKSNTSDGSAVGAGLLRRRSALADSPKRRMAPSAMSYAFVGPYLLFTIAFGLGPAIYALYLGFTKRDGSGFAGFANFTHVMKDFRFVPAVEHVGFFVGIWLVALIVLVTFFSLLVHSIGASRVRTSLRTIYYLPGALAGASSVMLWLFLLDPTASPANFLLRAMGMDSFNQVVVPSHMPVIFAIIAFWAGAGGWIVIMYGALNNISQEIMEAARIDGAGPLQLALRIQIPMIRKWIAYMVIMSVAAGVQLFVEPQFLSQATQGSIPNDYSLNQLAYQYAFKQNDFHGASAISLLLLVVALSLSAIFVARGGLFDKE